MHYCAYDYELLCIRLWIIMHIIMNYYAYDYELLCIRLWIMLIFLQYHCKFLYVQENPMDNVNVSRQGPDAERPGSDSSATYRDQHQVRPVTNGVSPGSIPATHQSATRSLQALAQLAKGQGRTPVVDDDDDCIMVCYAILLNDIWKYLTIWKQLQDGIKNLFMPIKKYAVFQSDFPFIIICVSGVCKCLEQSHATRMWYYSDIHDLYMSQYNVKLIFVSYLVEGWNWMKKVVLLL